ncbi:MAG: SWIM zinc finger family protein, partial [Streptomyces sp.]|nr:SWIM zinc finger family protein [Streptomyces sp.]
MRAARERESTDADGRVAEPAAADTDVTTTRTGVQSAAKPGDAARAALRRANAERRGAPQAEEDAASPQETGQKHPSVVREAVVREAPGTLDADRETAPAARPSDAAREALRAAREEADRAETGTGEGAARRPSGTPTPSGPRAASGPARPTVVPGRRGTRTRAHSARVLHVRELLADAFELPVDAPRGGTALIAGEDDGSEREETPQPSLIEDQSLSGRREENPPPRPGRTTPDAPSPARYPRSMAAPSRDGELRRTFATLPTPPADQTDRFAGTWWGNAWVAALEEGALDTARLARGRAYAGGGNVDSLTVTPGLVLAYVQGSRPRPYRTQVRLRTFSDDEWDRFLDAAAEQPGHIAALLDKEVPRTLAECGVRLLPGPGDLEPQCSCPDNGHPCKHAAAVCYQTARLLDQDPFVLLLLRGRGERELLDALSRRNAARAAREREPAPVPGVRARDAVARPTTPLPAPLPPPAHPEQPPVYPGTPGGPDPLALDQLATDAAARAHVLLTTGHDPVAELTLWQDAVRLAAARPGSGLTVATRALYSSLAAATGRAPSELARAVAAWR